MKRVAANLSAILLMHLAVGTLHAGSLYLNGHDILLHSGQSGYDAVILDYLREKGRPNEIMKKDYTISIVGSGVGGFGFTGGNYYVGSTLVSGTALATGTGAGALAGYKAATYYQTGSLTPADWGNSILKADALIILSHQSCGGCDLDDAGSAEINSYAADIGKAFDAGLDIWANSGAQLGTYYDFLPKGAVTKSDGINFSSGFMATSAGTAIGIVDTTAASMINGYPTHNQFSNFSNVLTAMEVHPDPAPLEYISLGLQGGTFADFTSSRLSDLLRPGTSLFSGDKQFSEFEYHGGGDMPAAEDVFVKAITDAEGNVGIRFQGAFVDAFGGGASDALIDFKVTAPEGKLIKDVHMGANPLVIGGGDKAGLVSVTETFLPDNDQTVLSVFDVKPGSRQLTDWADLVDENGELAPVQELHVQKDIIAWAQQLGSAATLSFIDQTFSQCDADPMLPGRCRVDDHPMGHPGDFNGDGVVDAADYSVWRDGLGTTFTLADFDIWKANFGSTWSHADDALSSAAVPEPTTILMFGILGGVVFSATTRRAA